MSPVTNILPLVVVLTVSLIKEAFEDNKRRVKDAEVCVAGQCSSHQAFAEYIGMQRSPADTKLFQGFRDAMLMPFHSMASACLWVGETGTHLDMWWMRLRRSTPAWWRCCAAQR